MKLEDLFQFFSGIVPASHLDTGGHGRRVPHATSRFSRKGHDGLASVISNLRSPLESSDRLPPAVPGPLVHPALLERESLGDRGNVLR